MKKYIVTTWVKIEKVFDEKEKAVEDFESKKKQSFYRDTILVKLVPEK